MAVLFEYGESRGISPAYHTIAVATGENTANIRKIRKGENLNPGLRTLSALASYFHVGLDYFLCETRADCEGCLTGIAQQRLLSDVPPAMTGISEDGLKFLIMVVHIVRKAEGLPQLDDWKRFV
jgi:transcriptional regulator with XRE-family HTH domain